MEKNFHVGRLKQSHVSATMELLSSKGDKRVRKQRGVSKLKENGLDSVGITVFEEPADIKNTAVLIDEDRAGDDKVWVYLPALKKNRRLPGSGKKESFVGSDFTYGDIIVPKVEEYKHTLVGKEPCIDVPSVSCFVVESIPASPAVLEARGVSSKKSWIRSDNFVTVKYETKDSAGRPWKSFTARSVKLVDPVNRKYIPFELEITDVQTRHRTRLIVEKIDIFKDVPDSLLNAKQLERGLPR